MMVHWRVERVMYKYLLAHIELILSFHSMFWGMYLLLRVADWTGETWSVLRVLAPAPLFGAVSVTLGFGLFLAVIMLSLTWRRRLLWALAHLWLLVAIGVMIGNYSSLGAVNYLTMFALYLAEYLRIAAVADVGTS